jgi:hypothetical protein
MATMLDWTTQEQRSSVCFFMSKRLNANYIHEEMVHVYGGKCLLCKAVHNWIEKRGIYFVYDEEVETEVRKWLRQQ